MGHVMCAFLLLQLARVRGLKGISELTAQTVILVATRACTRLEGVPVYGRQPIFSVATRACTRLEGGVIITQRFAD